jgi:hypothetical protein
MGLNKTEACEKCIGKVDNHTCQDHVATNDKLWKGHWLALLLWCAGRAALTHLKGSQTQLWPPLSWTTTINT